MVHVVVIVDVIVIVNAIVAIAIFVGLIVNAVLIIFIHAQIVEKYWDNLNFPVNILTNN